MDWQQFTALAIVSLTAIFFAWSALRPRKLTFEKQTHCGCRSKGPVQQSSILLTGKKGERPQIVVKMK